MSFMRTFCITAMVALFVSCSLQAPEIKVTGERSLLEKQILGSYQAFQEELWMQGTLRGLPDSMAVDEARAPLLKALRRRRYNGDDRQKLLSESILAEGFKGQLQPAPGTVLEDSPLAQRILNQENEDRLVLLERLRLLHPELAPEGLGDLFRLMLRDESPAGTLLQDADGEWKRK